ncbi:hypothetical protein BJ742DRAFT_415137 [Cladochytrium replicatum]|nr:hypothetical protein BJ742DRAFT_415137 [Cladochytrium replicatum]
MTPETSTANGSAPPSVVRNLTDKPYVFPRNNLKTSMNDPTKEPLVIVACGSFSPVTYLHLRMFEMAHDYIVDQGRFEILGGYFSPVSDDYRKLGLVDWRHRVRMCDLAIKDSDWLMTDSWEPSSAKYQRTATVLDHFEAELNGQGGITLPDGTKKLIRIMFLAGGDLIQTVAIPGVWDTKDLHHIFGKFGCLIIERTGADVNDFLLASNVLWEHRKNVFVVKQSIHNDISSTKIRLFIRRGMSIKYLLPDLVIEYIKQHDLYKY